MQKNYHHLNHNLNLLASRRYQNYSGNVCHVAGRAIKQSVLSVIHGLSGQSLPRNDTIMWPDMAGVCHAVSHCTERVIITPHVSQTQRVGNEFRSSTETLRYLSFEKGIIYKRNNTKYFTSFSGNISSEVSSCILHLLPASQHLALLLSSLLRALHTRHSWP